MSDPDLTQRLSMPSGAPTRPAVLKAANLLLVVAALAIASGGVVGLAYGRAVTDAFRHAYAEVPEARFSMVSVWTAGVILLLIAFGLLLLAIFNHRGSRTARINTWLLGALLVCWGGSSVFSQRQLPTDAPDPAELARLLAAARPAWVNPVTTGSIAVAVTAVLAAMVLLTLPAAHQFYAADRSSD